MSWLTNPWVVGIGGGVLSGLIVTFISRLFLSRRENKEYAQKVASVNREMISTLKLGVADYRMPSVESVEALISATARKYGVDEEDVYGIPEITEHLVKEVMDTNFISSSDKQDLCDKVHQVRREKDAVADQVEMNGKTSEQESALSEYRRRSVSEISVLLGFVATFFTLSTTLILRMEESPLGFLGDSGFEGLLSIVVASFTMVASVLTFWVFRRVQRFRYPRKASKIILEEVVEDEPDNGELEKSDEEEPMEAA